MTPEHILTSVNVEEISFVDVGDNPEAHIIFSKKKSMRTEGGAEYPAEAFAYVPDPSEPSTWKLRLWDSPEEKETAAQVGRAVAALGEGFRGNKVEIPEEDLPGVKAKVLSAWKRTHDGEPPEVLTKQQGEQMTPEELQAALDEANAKIEELTAQLEGGEPDDMTKGLGEVKEKIYGLSDMLRSYAEAKITEDDVRAQLDSILSDIGGGAMGKSIPEPIRKKYKEMEKRVAEQEERIARMEDEELKKEWIAKAKDADLTEDVGLMIKSLARTDKAMAEALFTKMAELSKQVSEGELLKEAGQHGVEVGAIEKINAAAAEIRKADPKLTEQQAFARAYQIHKGEM